MTDMISNDLREKLDQLVRDHRVLLFMKGTRSAPQCGFSATVVDILDDYLDGYQTVNVLAEPDVREGIKAYSDWPTIPQLYVGGEFVGGCDIIKEMRKSGELEKVLGSPVREVRAPEVTLTDKALAKLKAHWDGPDKIHVRLAADRQFAHELAFDEPAEGDFVLQSSECVLLVDRKSAARVDGTVIDWLDSEGGGGFKIDNPNAPPKVKNIQPTDLKEWLDSGKPIELFDVRSDEEIETASIPGARQLDSEAKQYLEKLEKTTTLVFICHLGMRSAAAAEHCLRLGFRDVYNVTGGIDAWSQTVDPSVPRY